MRMVTGDQWPDEERSEREADGRPTLTINLLAPRFLLFLSLWLASKAAIRLAYYITKGDFEHIRLKQQLKLPDYVEYLDSDLYAHF